MGSLTVCLRGLLLCLLSWHQGQACQTALEAEMRLLNQRGEANGATVISISDVYYAECETPNLPLAYVPQSLRLNRLP